MRYAAIVVAGLAAGCGSEGAAPAIDAPPGALDAAVVVADAAPPADADLRVCAVAGDCACFSNADCPAETRCHALDDSGTEVWCLPGARGAGALGEACTIDDDCASALCVEDANAELRCSILCTDETDCGGTLPRCLYIGFGVDESICAPPAG